MKEKLKSLLLDNLGLKLISLALAFLLWFVVISIDDPVKEKTLTNIKVNLVNAEELEAKGMIWEVVDGTDMLKSVTFDAPLSVREVIEASDIVAEANLGEITVADTVAIEFSCPKYNGQVTNISGNISKVKLSVEERVSKWIDIKPNIIGEVAEGYVIGAVSLEQNRLEIEGPESKVAEITRAVVDVNVAGVSGSNMSIRADIHLIDAQGNVVSYPTISKNTDSVRVTVDIHSTKEVPIEYQVYGEPAEGYLLNGMSEITPKKVLLAGTTAILNRTSKVTIPVDVIDVTGVTGDLEQVVDLKNYLPTGTYFAESGFDGKVYVTVYVEPVVEKGISLKKEYLTILNVPEGYVVECPGNVNMPVVTLLGLEADLADVNEIKGTIDVGAYMEILEREEIVSGLYALPVTFDIPEGLELKDTVSVYLEFATQEEIEQRAMEELKGKVDTD